jgi:hypothetical protein
VLADNYWQISKQADSVDPKEVWESVRIIVADQLGVKLEDISKESRFVADLGVG